MKKSILMICVLTVLAFALCAAIAAEKGNPRWQHIQDLIELRESGASERKRGGVTVNLECTSEPTLEAPGRFVATVNGGNASNYYYEFGIIDEDRDPHGFLYCGENGTDPVLDSVQLYSTGNYVALVWVYESDQYDSSVAQDWVEFTITGPETASLEYKAAQIVAQCRGTDDWHTALNLHDWLTHNAYYDHDLEYYGADIMFRGYGVCDSYSKAYKMLCLAAGIDNDRVTSNQLWHAWNAIKLSGEWYQVDVTWDDPGSATVPVSGLEGYDYFCLNDELMDFDHHCTDATFTPGCTSLEANYYIHEGLWRRYGIAYLSDEQGYGIPNANGEYQHDMLASFTSAVDSGETDVELAWELYWTDDLDGLYYMHDKEFMLFTYGMNTLDWTVNGDPAVVEATYAPGSGKVVLHVLEVTPGGYVASLTLLLPADLVSIGSRAFEDVAARAVVIQPYVVYIAEDAFENSRITTIYGFEGSAAEAFANASEALDFVPIDADWLASH